MDRQIPFSHIHLKLDLLKARIKGKTTVTVEEYVFLRKELDKINQK